MPLSLGHPLLLPMINHHHNGIDNDALMGTTEEPLVRFSFAKFLANPCGLMSSLPLPPPAQESHDSGDAATDVSQDEALQLLDPLRQSYNVSGSSLTIEEQVVVIEEFLLVLQEAKHRAQLMHSPMVRLLTFIFIESFNFIFHLGTAPM